MNRKNYKILLVQPCYENFGGYFRTFAMARSLARLNNKVTMLISNKENACCFKKSTPEKGLTQIELPRGILRMNGRFIRAFLGCWHILVNTYDYIICCGITQPESSIPLVFAWFIGKKVILDRDELWQANFSQGHWIMRKYVWFCEEVLIKLFNTHIVTSDLLVEHSKKYGARNVIKIINGVDLDQFSLEDKVNSKNKLGLASDDKTLLTFGNTYGNQRALLIFKAFAKVLESNSCVKLFINENPKDYLKEFGIDSKVLDNIIVTGFIEPKSLGLYLAGSDIVLFLTGNTDNEKACFPVRIGSYLNGEGVIATVKTDTEWCRVLQNYNCAIIGQDISDLAKKINYYLNNKNELKDLRERVRIAKKELNWNSLGQEIINLLNRINNVG